MEEIDASYHKSALELSAAIFKYQISNLIGPTPDPTVPTGLRYENAGRDGGRGGELRVQWQALGGLKASLQYSYQRHDYKNLTIDDGQTAPRQLLDATLEWAPVAGWSASVSGRGVAERGRLPGDPLPSPPNYVLCNLAVSRRWEGGLSLRGRVTNLSNHVVYDSSQYTATLPYGVPEPGRIWRISIVQEF